MRYPHTLGFGLACLALGVPFVVRTVCPAYEIYPSVVLPARASLLDVEGGSFIYKAREFAGVSEETGETLVLDSAVFLDPIPPQTKGVLSTREFYLKEGYRREVYFKYLPLSGFNLSRADITAQEQRETKLWISWKLQEAGCKPYEFILRKVAHKVGEEREPKVTDEKLFRLN